MSTRRREEVKNVVPTDSPDGRWACVAINVAVCLSRRICLIDVRTVINISFVYVLVAAVSVQQHSRIAGPPAGSLFTVVPLRRSPVSLAVYVLAADSSAAGSELSLKRLAFHLISI